MKGLQALSTTIQQVFTYINNGNFLAVYNSYNFITSR